MQDLREIVLDTETTGLRVKDGHRVIEIGCVELINKIKTGRTFHTYLNPKRRIDPEAFAVHGISQDFVADKPIFAKVVDSFMEFIQDSILVIHNAVFDIQFLNQELSLVGISNMPLHRAVDTLLIARKKFPGAQASLDALCRRFNISLHTREKHGALVDAELLALVYIEMTGASQGKFHLDSAPRVYSTHSNYATRKFNASKEEVLAHRSMMSTVQNPLWQDDNFAHKKS